MTPQEEQKFRDWGNAMAKAVKSLQDEIKGLRSDVAVHENKINVLSTNLAAARKEVDGYKTLLVDLRGEPAVELHGSISDKTEFNLEEAKEILQDPKNKGL